MYAVEFEADSKGGSIRIPEQHRELSDRHLRIIAMVDENSDARRSDTTWEQDLKSVSVWDE